MAADALNLKGHFLFATPQLGQGIFFRSVIFLVQHDAGGALGLIVNRPLSVPIRDAWKQISQTPCVLEGVLLQGGPCDGVMMALHADETGADEPVIDGVRFAAQREAIEHLVTSADGPVRLFVGYSGWGAGQLEREIAEGSWQSLAASANDVFDPKACGWDQVRRRYGRANLARWMNPSIIPDDPNMN